MGVITATCSFLTVVAEAPYGAVIFPLKFIRSSTTPPPLGYMFIFVLSVWWAFLFHPVGFADAQTYVKSHSNFQHLGGVSGQKRCDANGSHIYTHVCLAFMYAPHLYTEDVGNVLCKCICKFAVLEY